MQPNKGPQTAVGPLVLSIFLTLLALAAPQASAIVGPSLNQSPKVSVEAFNIAAEPSSVDWKYFLNATPSFRQGLWQYHLNRGKSFKDWAWQWRLGWVRACSEVSDRYCEAVFKSALIDKAVVVRADAASRLGRLYEGTGSNWAANLLLRAAKDPRNMRHGQPLYIQQRILYALKQIGGRKTLDAAGDIARTNKTTSIYWAKLNNL